MGGVGGEEVQVGGEAADGEQDELGVPALVFGWHLGDFGLQRGVDSQANRAVLAPFAFAVEVISSVEFGHDVQFHPPVPAPPAAGPLDRETQALLGMTLQPLPAYVLEHIPAHVVGEIGGDLGGIHAVRIRGTAGHWSAGRQTGTKR